ncbi:MAG: PAS domain S-box protein [Bacteroidia bacterium]|jgi:PAS domain S-box-containing protein|nr:PAS domain S-box protein [Bacteroidia bacterium]
MMRNNQLKNRYPSVSVLFFILSTPLSANPAIQNTSMLANEANAISAKLFLLAAVVMLMLMVFFSFYRGYTSALYKSLEYDVRAERSELEIRWLFLALGCLFSFVDLIFTLFIKGSVSFTITSILMSGMCLLFFGNTNARKLIEKRSTLVLGVSHFLLTSLLLIRSGDFSGELIPFGLFCLLVFYSYFIFNTIAHFWSYGLALSFLLATLWSNGIFPEQETAIYFTSLFILGIFNFGILLIKRNTDKYLLFTNKIVNQGTSLIVGTNAKEELIFVSDNIKDILGYDKKNLHSGNWFKETLAPDDTEEAILEKVRSAKLTGKIYSRKMKTAWGTYKWVQWQYKKFGNDLVIGIGQEVTDYIKKQEQYQNFIFSASDIIHKTDKDGNFVFVNPHIENLLGYEAQELLGQPYTNLVRKDHIKRLQTFYERAAVDQSSETIEFPALKKSGEEVWLSQNMTVERDINGEVLSYNSILRDITVPKQIEQENLNKQLKIELHSKLLRELTFISTSKDLEFESIIQNIIEKAAAGIKSDRISIWYCVNEHIRSDCFYERSTKKYWREELFIAKDKHPLYFGILKKGEIIATDDVLANEATKELFEDYFSEHQTQSLLDVPIFLEGKLEGILCNESKQQKREWDTEDINFARSVAGLITLAIEANKRKQAEAQLEERSKILAAVGTITERLLVSKNALATLGENLHHFGEALKCGRVYLYENKLNEESLELKQAWYSSPNSIPCVPFWRSDFFVNSVNSFFIEHSRNVHFSFQTPQLEPGDFKTLLESHNVMSMLVLPIHSGKDFLGFLGIDYSETSKTWTRDIITLIHSLITNVVHTIERLNNERTILESENNFRQINETIKDVFWLYDSVKKCYLYISPSCKEVLGMSQEEFYAGKNFGESFVLEEDLLSYVNALNSLKTQSSYEIEYRIKTNEGKIKWISEKSSAIRNENGVLIRNSGICSDISEKKDIQNQIRQLSLVAEKTNNGVVILDRNGFVLWANQSYLNILETSIDQLLHKRPGDIFTYKNKAQNKDADAINGSNYNIVFEVETPLGNKKWIEVNNTIIENDEGNTVQQIQIVTDITQKRVKDLELSQHRAMLRKYSSFLEYQNELKELLMRASSIEEISRVALKFVRQNIKNCIHISLLLLDDKKQNLSGYYILGDKIERERHSVKSFKSYETVKTGELFIEADLDANAEKSSSDIILIEYGAKSYVVLPLIDLQDIIGLLTITFDIPFNTNDSEKENLRNLSINLSTTIQKLNLQNSLQEKNNDIRDSLIYARNIQKAMLPDLRSEIPSLHKVVLLFKPKDIVSGDFYWAKENEKYIYLALGDCTGHGVPGAFLTIIGSRILEQIIRDEKVNEPEQILSELDKQIFYSLNATNKGMIRDGMEIALCVIDKTSKQLHFSGVGMGLVYHLEHEEIYLKGNRGSIGDYQFNEGSFEKNTIQLTGKERFYMASDGYQDQLGGRNYKRYSKRKLLDELQAMQDLPPLEQEKILKDNLKHHMKEHFQTDDISLLGFQLNL